MININYDFINDGADILTKRAKSEIPQPQLKQPMDIIDSFVQKLDNPVPIVKKTEPQPALNVDEIIHTQTLSESVIGFISDYYQLKPLTELEIKDLRLSEARLAAEVGIAPESLGAAGGVLNNPFLGYGGVLTRVLLLRLLTSKDFRSDLEKLTGFFAQMKQPAQNGTRPPGQLEESNNSIDGNQLEESNNWLDDARRGD